MYPSRRFRRSSSMEISSPLRRSLFPSAVRRKAPSAHSPRNGLQKASGRSTFPQLVVARYPGGGGPVNAVSEAERDDRGGRETKSLQHLAEDEFIFQYALIARHVAPDRDAVVVHVPDSLEIRIIDVLLHTGAALPVEPVVVIVRVDLAEPDEPPEKIEEDPRSRFALLVREIRQGERGVVRQPARPADVGEDEHDLAKAASERPQDRQHEPPFPAGTRVSRNLALSPPSTP